MIEGYFAKRRQKAREADFKAHAEPTNEDFFWLLGQFKGNRSPAVGYQSGDARVNGYSHTEKWRSRDGGPTSNPAIRLNVVQPHESGGKVKLGFSLSDHRVSRDSIRVSAEAISPNGVVTSWNSEERDVTIDRTSGNSLELTNNRRAELPELVRRAYTLAFTTVRDGKLS